MSRIYRRRLFMCALGTTLSLGSATSALAQQTESNTVIKALSVSVINPEDLLDYSRTIVVPTTLVTVLAEGKVGAVRQSGLFQRGNATANASVNFKVLGLC